MVKRTDLEDWLNRYLNIHAINDYLPNGLQVEGKEVIDKIVTGVSIHQELIERAVAEGADALLVHHGMFWRTDPRTIKGHRKNRIKRLLENNISLFAYHLPLDLHPEVSHNRLILQSLSVDRIEEVEAKGKDCSLGLKGVFGKPVSFQKLIERINAALDTHAGYFQYGEDQVRNLLVVSGGGKNELEKLVHIDVDTFLTGDVKESSEYVAREEGVNYIFAGHYNTEKPGIVELGKKIEGAFPVEVQFIDLSNPL